MAEGAGGRRASRPPPAERQAAMRALYEQSRIEFHRSSLGVRHRWNAPSDDTDWTNGQLLVHIVEVLRRVPAQADALRQGKDFKPVPGWLTRRLHPVQYLMVRRSAQRLTAEELAGQYDAAHARVLRVIDELDEEEWERSGRVFGFEACTLHDWLEFMAGHVREHCEQLSRD